MANDGALIGAGPLAQPRQAASARLHVLGGLLLSAAIAGGCVSTAPTAPGAAPASAPATGADASAARADAGPVTGVPPAAAPGTPRRPGGYYLDDGPGDRLAKDLDTLAALPDPAPVPEPLHSRANRPYRVLGNDYRPMTRREPFVQRGVASWYGTKFHGQLTSIGEAYDMYRMTAAHPTLPIPSFVRVTNLENGRQVVVRVNDRGPFLHERAIDLSYLAAYKLGYVRVGSAKVEVELLDPAATIANPNAVLVAADGTADGTGDTAPGPALPAPAAPAAGHYLQLGAFNARDRAEAASDDLRRRLDWVQVPIQVASGGGLYRVQAGPYPAREHAARAGAQIESRTGLRPLLLGR